ncbi:MAG TPA: outer membrane protein assembly factor BamA [Thermoanaerobaculia bacterium]|nr:outer membrane protein assembly factor BamA [Thermoanaerobaculia bacterium]
MSAISAGARRSGAAGLAALLVAVLATAPRAATAQPLALPPATAGQVVESIEWEGLRSLSEETLRYYLGLQVGQPFDPVELNQKIHALWERQLVDDLTVEAEPGAQGLRLEVRVRERPVLRSIEYQGTKKLGRTEIQERIDKDRVQVREGLPLERGELERLEQTLLDMYREKGFRFADVDYQLEEVTPGEVRVRFTVDEGDKVKIGGIEFEGNTVFSDWRLRQAMRKTRKTGPVTRLLKRDIYNPATLQEDLQRVKDLYREEGYKNVALGETRLEVRARRPQAPTPERQKRRLFLEIPVHEGERWRFGEVSIQGNEKFTDQALLRAFQRPRGRGPWLRASAVDKGVEAVQEIYRNHGYIYAQVDVEMRDRGDGIADVIVKVFEGEQYRVRRLEFAGNDRTRDKVLRREFRVQEGMVLNMGALRSSLFKINQLGYFTLDEDNPIEFENFDSEDQTVDLVVKGEEADRTELLFGGGWSEVDGFFGQFSVRTQNFLGRGETLGVAVQAGKVRDLLEISYFVPWLLDRPQSAGFQLFSRDLDYVLGSQRQIREEIGGVLTYGRSFGLFNSLRFSYGYADLKDAVELLSAEGEVVRTEAEFRKSNLRPMWIYDSQDNRLEPTRGARILASLEYAGGLLGGNIDLWRPELSFTFYRPVTTAPLRTVLGLNVEGGWVEPYGDDELPIRERYYLGGARSVRGFANSQIFLRNDDGSAVTDDFGRILGGTQFVELGLEYHLLLGGPFRLVFFADAGNVFDEDRGHSFDIQDLRYSAGVELRLFVPVFGLPLRFIYAENLDPLPGDRFESFQFDVGTSF